MYKRLEFGKYCRTVLCYCYINLNQVIFHSASNHASLKIGNFIPENGIEMNSIHINIYSLFCGSFNGDMMCRLEKC